VLSIVPQTAFLKEIPMVFGVLRKSVTALRGPHRTQRAARRAATCRPGVELLEERRVPAAFSVVMSGLDNPRGLAFGPEGGLYVAEAGRGGDGPSFEVRPGVFASYGPSGAVSRLWHGQQERVVTGLPSLLAPDGATGPHDISFQGLGNTYVTIGFGGNPTRRAELGAVGDGFAQLVRLQPNGHRQNAFDVGANEAAVNPGGGPLDSNPYGLLAEAGGQVVVDAGGNALLRVAANGDVTTLAQFPSRDDGRFTDAVPTCVARGPDGAYYVGELTGLPFAAGAATLYRVVPGQAPEVVYTGFKTIIDIDFGPDGSLYVLQHASGPFLSGAGALTRIAPDGTRTPVAVEGLTLTRPSSVLVADDGAIYISNRGISVGTGEVICIPPSALRAEAAAPMPAAPALRPADVPPLLAEAVSRWQAAGGDTSSLGGIDVRVASLGGTTLGLALGNTIWLDDDAAGWGWFVDPTPASDAEFQRPGNQGEEGRIDLLSVLAHEFGHLLGLGHDDGGVMREELAVGQRATPARGTLEAPPPYGATWVDVALALDVGRRPAGSR
jgi:hypothetical protein